MNNASYPTTTQVSLVRHGHIQNPENVFHGRLPGFPLSEDGEAQAEAAGRFLAAQDVVAIYTSPLLRTRQTAGIIQRHLEPPPPVEIDERLFEIYSPYDGRPGHEMDAIDWDFYTGVAAPYEQPDVILARIRDFFIGARRHHPGVHTIGITHADPIAFAVMWVAGIPLEPARRRELVPAGVLDGYPATASISTFIFQSTDPDEIPRLVYHRPY